MLGVLVAHEHEFSSELEHLDPTSDSMFDFWRLQLQSQGVRLSEARAAAGERVRRGAVKDLDELRVALSHDPEIIREHGEQDSDVVDLAMYVGNECYVPYVTDSPTGPASDSLENAIESGNPRAVLPLIRLARNYVTTVEFVAVNPDDFGIDFRWSMLIVAKSSVHVVAALWDRLDWYIHSDPENNVGLNSVDIWMTMPMILGCADNNPDTRVRTWVKERMEFELARPNPTEPLRWIPHYSMRGRY